MATDLQKAVQLPLLLDIATRHGRIDASRAGDVPDIHADMRELFPEAAKNPNFNNEVLWAKKQLESNGLLAVEPRVEWAVTPQGLRHIAWHLGKVSEQHVSAFNELLAAEDESGQKFMEAVLANLPDEFVRETVLRTGWEYRSELAALCLVGVPDEELIGLFTSFYELIRDLFVKHQEVLSLYAVN